MPQDQADNADVTEISPPPPVPSNDAPDLLAERTRMCAALMRSATVLLSLDDEATMLTRLCTALTREVPEVALAWTWFGPADTTEIVPQARAGVASAYADGLRVERNAMTEEGPAFRALAGMRSLPSRVSADSPFGPWRVAATEHGICDVLALPLRSLVDDQRGVFVLYAPRENFFNEMGLAVFEAMAELLSAVLSRSAQQNALKHPPVLDDETGLYNHEALPMVADRLARPHERAAPASVLLLELDQFSRVTDSLGGDGADEVLRHVARALQAATRSGDLLLRLQHHQFLIGLPGVDAAAATVVAEKLRRLVMSEPHALCTAHGLRLSASVGVTGVQTEEALEDTLHRASSALQSARRSGHNRAVQA